MKLTPTQTINRKAGMTLIELTVVILVLLALIAVLFVGAKAYKDGADKSACIMNQRNVQQAYRSYVNLNSGAVPTEATLFGAGLFFATKPVCPKSGVYTLAAAIPAEGTLAFPCSLAGSDGHEPNDTTNW
jgi:type II secretory pathway pseudopilin PulG